MQQVLPRAVFSDGSHLISLHEIRVQLLFHLMRPNFACFSEEVVPLFKFCAKRFEL